MSDPTRRRINAAFDDELSGTPVPTSLRPLSIRAAVAAPKPRSNRPQLLVLVAALLTVAVVVTLVMGSRLLHPNAVPARPIGSLTPPSPRSEANLVYDAANRDLVLFGGTTIENKTVNETWTWDGKYWTLHHVALAPAPRSQSVMAYDEVHRDLVLYGGMAQTTGGKIPQAAASDTWTWNGTAWQQQHPKHQAVFSFDWPATMGFDPVSRTVLLYGFAKTTSSSGTALTSETWSWNGSDWAQLSPSTTPGTIGQLVGGGSSLYLLTDSAQMVGGRYVSQVWRWDGTTWTARGPDGDLMTMLGSAAFDPQSGTIVVLNGDTWTWNGSAWLRVHVDLQPPSVGYMAYFPPLHDVVMFGSRYGNTNNDMWAWTGMTWKLLNAGTLGPLPSPSGQLGPTTPGAAEAFIRQTVKTTSPVLLPTWLPADMEARVVATADGFNLDYASDQRDKTIFLGTVVAQPPPGGAGATDAQVAFRSGTAQYFVYDSSAPTSQRWLMWFEPGKMAVQQTKEPGVPYFLSAAGLTDQEFWQVANSLR